METIDFGKGNGLVPAIIQDYKSLQVLMLGYMSEEALEKTIETGKVTFYSRSKERLWTKGETSGHFLHFRSYQIDCDGDTLLIKAEPQGPACHTGTDTCFGNVPERAFDLFTLARIIRDRKQASPDTSYTARLLAKGVNKIAQKVGEEAVELVIEAKDDQDELFKGEAADLLYHFLVLLEFKDIDLGEVLDLLASRHQKDK